MPSGSRIVLRTAAEADIPTPDTDQSALFMNADDANAPYWKDDAGAFHELTGADGELSYQDHGNTGAAEAISWTTNVHRLVADSATVTLSYSSIPASGTYAVVHLVLTQDATGGRDFDFPAATDWGIAGEPVWTGQSASTKTLVTLETTDGGTTVLASVSGRQGPSGGAVAIPYTFSTTTTDADPGAGNLRLSNATQTSATAIRADLVASDGTTWTAVIDSLDDSTNTIKGHIRLAKAGDPSKWLLFTVSAVGSESGYRNITVSNVAGSASSPFSNGDPIILHFTRAGDAGVGSGATISTIDSPLGANVTMVNANTFYDGPSASYAAGTWLVVWKVTVEPIVGTSQSYAWTAKLWDGTTVYDETPFNYTNQANMQNEQNHIAGAAVVTLGGTTTLKVSVACNRGSSGSQIAKNIVTNGATSNHASTITGYKVV